MVGGAGAADVASFATEVPDRFGTRRRGVAARAAGRRGDGNDSPAPLRGPRRGRRSTTYWSATRMRQPDRRRPRATTASRAAAAATPRSGDKGADSCHGVCDRSCHADRLRSRSTRPSSRPSTISPAGGGDFVVLPAKAGADRLTVSASTGHRRLPVSSLGRPIAIGDGCTRAAAARCRTSPARSAARPASFVADLGAGDDRLSRCRRPARRRRGPRVTGGAGDDDSGRRARGRTWWRPGPGADRVTAAAAARMA